jgi:hypothetical protein
MLIDNKATPAVDEVNRLARAAGVSGTPRPPSACLSWYDQMIEDYYLSVLGGGNLDLANWMATTGRDRFLRFLTEYQIAERIVPKGASPVDSLKKNRLAMNRSGANGVRSARDGFLLGDVPFEDHTKWWRTRDKQLIFTSHPYYDTVKEIRDVCEEFAERVGLRVEVRPDLNFYSHLEQTPLVVWRSK